MADLIILAKTSTEEEIGSNIILPILSLHTQSNSYY